MVKLPFCLATLWTGETAILKGYVSFPNEQGMPACIDKIYALGESLSNDAHGNIVIPKWFFSLLL